MVMKLGIVTRLVLCASAMLCVTSPVLASQNFVCGKPGPRQYRLEYDGRETVTNNTPGSRVIYGVISKKKSPSGWVLYGETVLNGPMFYLTTGLNPTMKYVGAVGHQIDRCWPVH